jgi:hypothetical protein
VSAKINNKPALILEIIKYSESGITDQTNKEGISISIGAVRKMPLLALVGMIISFDTSLSTSAIGCKRPEGPTLIGPILDCINPIIFLSE